MTPANTIVFVTDNHARSAVGCYGERTARTPAIDSLASRGIRFDNAYCASPLCCPARAALASGRYPHQTGFYDNVLAYDGSVPSWMHRARAAGCQVVSIGKLHFRSGDDDNGFTEELISMHILNKRGGTAMLLRASGGELEATGQWELYTEQSGIGTTVYQQYDRDITRNTIEWLRREARTKSQQPWILFVSFASPHPPFLVPTHIDRMFDVADMPLPAAFRTTERTSHPSITHLRTIMGTKPMEDEGMLRRVAKAYFGLVNHVDRQIGEILGEIEALELGELRMIYTSDHGEMLGAQGVFGKSCLLEGAIKVPMIISGAGVPQGRICATPVSHVDLFPTLLDSLGVGLLPEDDNLPGVSLFQQLPPDRPLFAEYHATGSTGAAFVLRRGAFKLIYHVDHPNQLFDLEKDPDEIHDLPGRKEYGEVLKEMIGHLRGICDPEEVDRAAKRAQSEKVEEFGGREALIRAGTLVYTPPPGKSPELREIK